MLGVADADEAVACSAAMRMMKKESTGAIVNAKDPLLAQLWQRGIDRCKTAWITASSAHMAKPDVGALDPPPPVLVAHNHSLA